MNPYPEGNKVGGRTWGLIGLAKTPSPRPSSVQLCRRTERDVPREEEVEGEGRGVLWVLERNEPRPRYDCTTVAGDS